MFRRWQSHASHDPHHAGVLLNMGLASAFVFSYVISYTGVIALLETVS